MSANQYGIFNSSSGIITLGTKDGIVDTAIPDITGREYGIYNSSNGFFYFYDGILKGTTKSVKGAITEIEEGTTLSGDIGTATELSLVQNGGNEAKIGETEYATLEEAISNCSAGQTIQLLRSIALFAADSPITIAQGQEVMIDMAGHHIVSAIEENTILNQGTLSLINTAETESTIQTNSTNWIINKSNATMVLNHIVATNAGTGTILQNAGNVEITDCTFKNTTGVSPIKNEGGTLQIQSGTIEVESGIAIENHGGTIIQNGGTIDGGNKKTYWDIGVWNIAGAVIQNDGVITGSLRAITNENGNMTIVGGNVENTIYSTGTVTVGTKDGNLITDTPVIQNGITNDGGQFHFYDGTVTGGARAIEGMITDIETNTELLVTDSQTITLQIVDGQAASVDGTTYETLQDAIDACADNTQTTITVLRNTVVSNAEIANTKNIVLNINGKVVTQYQPLVNYGTLKIIDNSGLDTGNITSYQGSAIQNAGILEIAGGKIGNNAIGIQNTGTCNMVSGTIDGNSIGISNESTGTLTVAGGTISNNTQGIAQKGTGTTSVTSGTFDTNTSATYATAGTIVVENATFTGNTYANHVAGGRITVVNGTFTNNQHGMYIQSGQGFSGIKDTVVGEMPNIVGTVSGIKVDKGSALHFYDGKIQGTNAAIEGYATYLEDGYKVQSSTVDGLYTDTLALAGTVQTVARVDDVEFSSVQAAINSCIGDTAKTVTLLNTVTVNESLRIDSDLKVILDLNKHNIEGNFAGSIIDNSGELTIIDSSTEKTGKIINSGGQGIYNTGTLTIGTDDGTIEETVRVEGSTIGLQTTGTFNYYDGLLAGTTVIDGNVSSLPSGSVIRTRTENGLTVYYID